MKRKDRTAEKAAADPQAVQRGRLRAAAPFGLVFRVVLVAVSRRVLGCGARQRGALVIDKHTPWCQLIIDKHTPWCQLNKFCGLKQNDNYLKNFNYVKKQIFH